MNRKSAQRPSDTLSEEQKLIEELIGHTDISMQREALALCSRFLRRKWISPEGFDEVVRVIGMFGSKKRWASRLEAAIARQSARIRRAMQGTMLVFYAASNDWENALRFASTRRDLLSDEIAFAIDVFARVGRAREVRCLGLRIERWVERIDSNPDLQHAQPHELDWLLFGLGVFKAFFAHKNRDDGLAWFFAEGPRGEAILNWKAGSLTHPIGQCANYRAIDLELCMVLEHIRHKIRCVEEIRRHEIDDTALALPGNQDGIYAEMLTRFNRYRRALERLVSEKRRKELGMDRPSTAD